MMAEAMFTCQELIELVTEYLESALGSADRARFEEHLAACEPCAAYLEQMRETIRLTGLLSAESLDPAERDELLHVFRQWKTGG